MATLCARPLDQPPAQSPGLGWFHHKILEQRTFSRYEVATFTTLHPHFSTQHKA
jgi:hypothetical protein